MNAPKKSIFKYESTAIQSTFKYESSSIQSCFKYESTVIINQENKPTTTSINNNEDLGQKTSYIIDEQQKFETADIIKDLSTINYIEEIVEKSHFIDSKETKITMKDLIFNNNFKNNTKRKEKEEEIKYYDTILESIDSIFISENYDTSKLDRGEDEVIETEKTTVTFTTFQNQKNNTNNNITIIELGECEKSLRNHYNISNNQTLYMKKIEVNQEGMKIPKIEYEVYCKFSGKNLTKLNLSVCSDIKIYLSVPSSIPENIDILNSSSGYYNDLCYIATSESGTDILLKDRKNEYINKTICQDDYDFLGYDYETQKANCSCKVKE